MHFKDDASRTVLRDMIQSLADQMHARGDSWLLKDCTVRKDSWYNRHRHGNMVEKKEKLEKKQACEVQGI